MSRELLPLVVCAGQPPGCKGSPLQCLLFLILCEGFSYHYSELISERDFIANKTFFPYLARQPLILSRHKCIPGSHRLFLSGRLLLG